MTFSEKIIRLIRNTFDTVLYFAVMAVKEDFRNYVGRAGRTPGRTPGRPGRVGPGAWKAAFRPRRIPAAFRAASRPDGRGRRWPF